MGFSSTVFRPNYSKGLPISGCKLLIFFSKVFSDIKVDNLAYYSYYYPYIFTSIS